MKYRQIRPAWDLHHHWLIASLRAEIALQPLAQRPRLSADNAVVPGVVTRRPSVYAMADQRFGDILRPPCQLLLHYVQKEFALLGGPLELRARRNSLHQLAALFARKAVLLGIDLQSGSHPTNPSSH